VRLLVDLGNTRLKCALADGLALRQTQVFVHADAGDGFIARLSDWLARIEAPQDVWLASVAGEALTGRVQDTFELAGHRVHQVVTQAQTPSLRVAYAEPQRLGVDRWLAMLAARARAATPVVVASVGSALTVDAVDARGQHLGGLIAPTPEAMREALYARAPQLRSTAGTVRRLANNTEDAVASGTLLAGIALIERAFGELAQDLGTPPRLLLCGGGSEPLRDWLPPHEHAPNLVLEGLALQAAASIDA